MYQVIAITT